MTFLNPMLLLGLLAVSVPIIIHLLNRRRYQKILWAAMRFLQASVEKTQKRSRLEDMILLILRCVLLALLALALARPAILSEASAVFGQSRVTGVIILDNSQSMGMSDGTATRFQRAKEAAEAVLDSMPAGSATAVFLANDSVQAPIPEPTYDLNLVRKTLREAPLTDRATDLLPAWQQAIKTLGERVALRKEIYLLTDGQALGWRRLTEIQRALENSRSEIKSHVILVNEHEEQNLGVSDLRAASGLTPARYPLRFEAKISNYGRTETRHVRVALAVDDEPPSNEFTLENLPPGATRSVTLFAQLRTEGFHAVTARIPGDRLSSDDHRTVAVRALKEVKVLLVDGEPGKEPRESEVFFLKNALVPVAGEAATSYFIQTTTITAGELSQTRLDDFDAVILANVPDFNIQSVQILGNYLRRGGGLIVFPGDRLNASFYNEQLFRRTHLLPAEFGETRGQADQDATFLLFQDKNYQHPIVDLWNDPGVGQLASARFFKYYQLKPASVSSAKAGPKADDDPRSKPAAAPSSAGPADPAVDAGIPRVILNYQDGTPAVMERGWGLGRVIQFSSSADTAWNDLPVRLAWVPLIHRALGSIIQRQDEGLNARVGEKFVRRLPAEYLGKEATIIGPRAGEKLRELRRVELVDSWPTLRYDQTDVAGLYSVAIGDPPLPIKLAAQAEPAESSLEELSSAQQDTLSSVVGLVRWSPNLSLRGLVTQSRTGLEFWLPLTVLCLLLAAAETLLGQWFSRSR